MRKPWFRKLLWALLCLSAFSVCMIPIQKAFAEDKPLAVCKDGKCTMTEADYNELKKFLAEVFARAEHNDKVEAEINERLNGLAGALENCKERQKQWKTKH